MALGQEIRTDTKSGFKPGLARADEVSGVQVDIVRYLSGSEAFGQVLDERIDTHISHVFLVGNKACKLKRAIKFNFIDFTSLDARKQACERELEINSRIAPEIYIGVSAITRCGSSFQIDGDGEVVDYIVVMKRFDQDTLFNHLCAANELKETLISDLAEQIAKLHSVAEVRTDLGGSAAISKVLQEMVLTLMEFDGGLFATGSVKAWRDNMASQIEKQSRKLDLRCGAGFVRQCHGDLHLGNICLASGRPTPFDAIEFGDAFSCIDVLYDLAFPVMDLVACDARGLSNLLFNRYLEVTSDYSGLHLMPLFLSLRAGVRAMVHALRSRSLLRDARDEELAQSYFHLAESFLVPTTPGLIAVGGISGSGKSTLARGLATSQTQGEGSIVLRNDAVRKHLFHQSALVPLPLEAYSDRSNKRVFRALCRDAHRALTSGHNVIVDATMLDERNRALLEDLAFKLDAPFVGLWLEADKDLLLERIKARKSDVSDADEAVVLAQLKRGLGAMSWNRIDANCTPQKVLRQAIEVLKSTVSDKMVKTK